jgi:PAS domain S-box-containing protein
VQRKRGSRKPTKRAAPAAAASSGGSSRARKGGKRPSQVDGSTFSIVGVGTSVDELQQSAQRAEKLLTTILDATKDLLVIILDRQGRILQFNRPAQQLTGCSLKEVKGRRLWDILPVLEERAQVKDSFREMLRGAGSMQAETHWRTQQGELRLIAWSTGVAVDDRGAVEHVIRTGVDVTERERAKEQARESKEAVRTLLETVPEAVVTHDTEGRIMLVNPAAEAMFGYERKEMIGQSLAMLIPERFRHQHAGHVESFFQRPRMRPMGAGLNLLAARKDGSEFPVEIGLSYFETRTGMVGVSFVSDITERKKIEATLLQDQKELQSLTARLLDLQEAGNKDLARELHDDLSQKLAALGMEISTLLQPSVKSPKSLPERIRVLSTRTNDLAEDVHALSRRLHPAILDELGLEAALREECIGFAAQGEVPPQFESERVPSLLPEDISLCLYRVAQESLRNIAKYAKAVHVRIVLSGKQGGIELRIEDTGSGFDVNVAWEKGGLGLISMEERVRLVNGTFTIRSQPGIGTTVEVFVPLRKKDNETVETAACR